MSLYIAAYDIANDRQREKVARVLTKYPLFLLPEKTGAFAAHPNAAELIADRVD